MPEGVWITAAGEGMWWGQVYLDQRDAMADSAVHACAVNVLVKAESELAAKEKLLEAFASIRQRIGEVVSELEAK